MKHITFRGAGMLAALATMLECVGIDTDDRQIALGMEAPFLFVRQQGCYHAGITLYRPEWLNLHLASLGMLLTVQDLPCADIPAFLRQHAPASLPLRISGNAAHPVVFQRYESGRYHFLNVKESHNPEPDALSLTSTMLKRRLTDTVEVLTLEPCAPAKTDFIPLLLRSLETLTAYQTDLLAARQQVMTRSEFAVLHQPLFRALLRDYYPLSALVDDHDLHAELTRLHRAYRHLLFSEDNVIVMCDHFSRRSIIQCIAWIREAIYERLWELGATDRLIDRAHTL